MTVINTKQILNKLGNLSNKLLEEEQIEAHRELICKPLKNFFLELTEEQLHEELLSFGLFDPTEEGLAGTIQRLAKQNVWEIIQSEFERLKSLWRGIDIPIYIFPLTKYRPIIEGIEVKKNGVALKGIILLFVSTDLKNSELKAMLAHEYNHICRLSHTQKTAQETSLGDSLIIEGMAECSVEELYGEEWLSPWTKRYTFEEAMYNWKKYFVPNLSIKDVKNHHTFLYGDEDAGLPSWIGYCLGYKIVKSYLNNNGPIKPHLLFKIPTTKIIQGSNYRV